MVTGSDLALPCEENIMGATQLPCPLVCGRAAAGDFHKCEVHLVFGPPPPVFRGGGLLADLAAAKCFWGVGATDPPPKHSIASRIPPGLFVWLLGRLVVWSFGLFRLGRDADAQKTAVDFSLQLRCRADPPPRMSTWAVKLIGGWVV